MADLVKNRDNAVKIPNGNETYSSFEQMALQNNQSQTAGADLDNVNNEIIIVSDPLEDPLTAEDARNGLAQQGQFAIFGNTPRQHDINASAHVQLAPPLMRAPPMSIPAARSATSGISGAFAPAQYTGSAREKHKQTWTMNGTDNLQLQMMQNQQIMMQQQTTVAGLMKKVDSLTKLMKNKQRPDRKDRDQRSKSPIYENISDSEGTYFSSDNDSSDDQSEPESVTPTKQTMPVQSDSLKLLTSMEFKKTEKVGPAVNDTLAATVNQGITEPVDRKAALKQCELQLRPENCINLRVPKVNKELWTSSSFRSSIKERDRKIQTAQQYLTAGVVPLVKLMDLLLKRNDADALELARDSFQMVAYAHRDMSNIRRTTIKPGINERYHQLCNDNTELTENLLGDNLEKQLKTVDEMRKLGKEMSKASYPKKQRKRDHQGNIRGRQQNHRKDFNRDQNRGSQYQNQPKDFLSRRPRQQSGNQFEKFRKKPKTME